MGIEYADIQAKLKELEERQRRAEEPQPGEIGGRGVERGEERGARSEKGESEEA
jgi:hypothetical protein